MRQFSATEAKQRLAELLDAAQRQPRDDPSAKSGTSQSSCRPREYRRLRGLNVAELERLCRRIGARAKRRGLTEEKLQELLADGD